MIKELIIVIVFISLGLACHQKQPAQAALKETASLPYFTSADFEPQWFKKGTVPANIHSIAVFSFTDQNGNVVTEKNVAGKIYVADFFFTSCKGICPKLTKDLKIVQGAFIDDPDVVLLSHSVTPDKDDTAALKRYARNYGVNDHKWFLLTGNRDSIYAIARKSYFADEQLGQQQDINSFLHTENMFLIDGKRRIRGIYKGTSPAEMENIIADIKILKTEKE